MDNNIIPADRAEKIFFAYMKGLEAAKQDPLFKDKIYNQSDYEKILAYLIFSFGSLDYLCQSLNLSTEYVIKIYRKYLRTETFKLDSEKAKERLNEIIYNTETDYGKKLMRKGAECIAKYVNRDFIDAFNILASIFKG